MLLKGVHLLEYASKIHYVAKCFCMTSSVFYGRIVGLGGDLGLSGQFSSLGNENSEVERSGGAIGLYGPNSIPVISPNLLGSTILHCSSLKMFLCSLTVC